MAQHIDLVDLTQVQVLADTSKSYFMPDVSQKDLRWIKRGNKLFAQKMGFAMIFDYELCAERGATAL
jgi:hypothetical protein